MNEDKARRYHRRRRVALVLHRTGLLAIGALLVVSGDAAQWRDLATCVVADASGSAHRVAALVVFVIGLVGLIELLTLPTAWYVECLLDRRYGLSTVSRAAWWRDQAKAAALSVSFAILGALIVDWTMQQTPDAWWVVTGLAFAAASVVLAWIAPVVVLPLFFRLSPLTRPELAARLDRLATQAGARVRGVNEWHLGARTRAANAALIGLGRTRRILISDTMLAQYSDDEIEVVLAHELGHHVHADLWRMLALDAGLVLAALLVAHGVMHAFVGVGGTTGLTDPALWVVGVMALSVSLALTTPLRHALSRRHERRADRFALDLTRHPEAFVSAMRRLGAQNLADESPSRLIEVLFHSHPPLSQRIAAARAWPAASA